MASFKADIFSVPRNKPPLIYDLIISIESLAKMGTILDFAKQKLTLDHVTMPMRPHNLFINPKVLQAQFLTAPQKPISTCNAAKQII